MLGVHKNQTKRDDTYCLDQGNVDYTYISRLNLSGSWAVKLENMNIRCWMTVVRLNDADEVRLGRDREKRGSGISWPEISHVRNDLTQDLGQFNADSVFCRLIQPIGLISCFSRKCTAQNFRGSDWSREIEEVPAFPFLLLVVVCCNLSHPCLH